MTNALLMTAALIALQPNIADRFGPPPAPPTCSVTLTVAVAERGDPLEELTYRYDAETQVWTFLAFNGAPPDQKELAEFEENGRDGGDRSDDPLPPASYYADSVAKLSDDWTLLSATDGEGPSLWALENLPDGTVIANGRDLSGNIRLSYLIEEGTTGPRVAVAAGQLKKRWRIPLIARIDAFAIQRRFAPAPVATGVPGAMLPVSEHVEIAADVLGRDRSAIIDTAFGDWDCRAGEAAAAEASD